MNIRVLIGCEYSGVVREQFAKRGFDAWSCDLLPTAIPGKHFQCDIREVLGMGWNCFICFPPCTDLAVSGAAHFKIKIANGKQKAALDFVRRLMNAPIEHIGLENPVSVISGAIRKPDQIIHPYYFGDNVPKKTCLWLKNLPKLTYSLTDNLFEHKTAVEPEYFYYNSKRTKSGKSRYSVFGKVSSHNRPKVALYRSKTFPGIAQAMGEQWGNYLIHKYSQNIKSDHEIQHC
jgi:hypothetical protein